MKTIAITTSQTDWPDVDYDDARERLEGYINGVKTAGAHAEALWLHENDDAAATQVRAQKIASQMDGLLIPGGADLPPSMYGEEVLQSAGVELIKPQRPQFETALVNEFVARRKPILGICYGCQFLNVWRAGSLIQDIPTQKPSETAHSVERGNILHAVRVLDHTKLRRIVGSEEFDVVSSHHQAIGRLGNGASSSAFAPDGLVEAIEFDDDSWIVGVQWHPERTPDNESTRRLFEAFVNKK